MKSVILFILFFVITACSQPPADSVLSYRKTVLKCLIERDQRFQKTHYLNMSLDCLAKNDIDCAEMYYVSWFRISGNGIKSDLQIKADQDKEWQATRKKILEEMDKIRKPEEDPTNKDEWIHQMKMKNGIK